MYRRSPLAILTIFITTGLISIGYNVYLLGNHETPLGSRFAYFALGLITIMGGLYVYRLQIKQEHSQEEYSQKQEQEKIEASYTRLKSEKEQLQDDYLTQKQEMEKLQVDYAHLEQIKKELEIQSQKLPKVCDLKNSDALPSLNPEQLYIMQQLFRPDYQIHVQPLQGGFNNSGIFRVIREVTKNNIPDKFGGVVKYLKVIDIRREIRAYTSGGILDRYPLRFNPGKLIGNWPPNHDLSIAQDESPGAVYYHLATLQQDSELRTLAEIYAQHSFVEIKHYLESLLDLLLPWHRRALEPPKPLGGVDGEYARLCRNRTIIQEHISDLLQLSDQKLNSLERINLPFLSGLWQQPLYNPIHWILNVLEPGQAKCFQAECRSSPIHGDLHTGNILVEQGKDTNIWLIDFPNAHVGRTLIDFATLEADVKFNLLDDEQCDLEKWLEFEDKLLTPLRQYPLRIPLIAPWNEGWQSDNVNVNKAWQVIGFLREQVMSFNLIGVDMRAYYLALLHSTLPVVYRNHSNFQKQCALTSAAWMCEYLNS